MGITYERQGRRVIIRHASHGHRTYRTLAECRWPRAAWVAGKGPFALVAFCDVPTVTLHETRESALASKRTIDDSACGGRCYRAHRIFDLSEGVEP